MGMSSAEKQTSVMLMQINPEKNNFEKKQKNKTKQAKNPGHEDIILTG